MNNDLDNLKFTTKSIMITNKQKEFIEMLLDDLSDYDNYEYADIEYQKLSKQDAKKLIQDMKDTLEDCRYDYQYGFYGGDMYTDNFYD